MPSISTGIVGVEKATHLACEYLQNFQCGVHLIKGPLFLGSFAKDSCNLPS